MKFNKIFLVSVILLAILTVGAASASDNITDDAMAADDAACEELTQELDENLELNDNDEPISANESEMTVTIVKQEQSGKIHKIDENTDIYVNDHDSDYFRIYFPQAVTGTLSLYIDGRHLQDKEIFSQKHFMFVNTRSSNLSEGIHTWKIDYSGDDDFNPASANGTFTLNPPSPDFVKKDSKMDVFVVTKDDDNVIYAIDENRDLSIKNTKTDYFKVKFPKEVSGKLYLYIDGELKATKNIKNKNHYFFANAEDYKLKAGKHTWKIVYSGDDEYNSTSVNGTYMLNVDVVKVPIKKIPTSLTVPKTKTFKTPVKTKKYTVTLKANKKAFKGAKVYLTITGKNYKKTFSAKTDSKGKATFKITKLTKKGTYKGTLTYKGNKNYKSVTTKLSIKITKKTCKFTRGKTTVPGDEYKTETNTTCIIDGPIEVPEAYNLLNAFRAEKGVWQWNKDDATKTVFNTDASNTLKPLERDEVLEGIAKIRAEEVYSIFNKTGELTHERPDHSYVTDLKLEGYSIKSENIAYTMSTRADDLVLSKQIKNTTEELKETNDPYLYQGHRRAMLSSAYDLVGIAGYKVGYEFYLVQVFGKATG